MLREALEYLMSQGVDAAESELAEVRDLGDGLFQIINRRAGTVKLVNANDVPSGTVASIEDLVKVAQKYNAFENVTLEGVFISDTKAVLQIGDETRPEARFTLPLRVNPIVTILRNACLNMDHKTCMRRLRVDLASAVLSPADFKTVISALKFETTSENATAVRKGDESIGKSIRAKVTGEGDIPEELTITFPVYPDVFGRMVSVRCSVIVESLDQKIHIIPIPGELERAMLDSQKWIADEIREALEKADVMDGPVICGTFCE